jgi:predicted transcriptional regulator
MAETQVALGRTEVRRILKRHPGCIARIADELELTPTSVSMYLRGRGTSARIAAACHDWALDMLKLEERQKKGDAA